MALFWPIENWDISEQLRAQTLWFCSLMEKGAGELRREKRLKKQVKKKVALTALLTMIVGHFRPLSIRVLPTQA